MSKEIINTDIKCLVIQVEYYYFEAFLKIVVLFKEHGIIDDDLWCGNAEVNDAVIDCFCRLRRKKRKNELY